VIWPRWSVVAEHGKDYCSPDVPIEGKFTGKDLRQTQVDEYFDTGKLRR
jgi:hypothetical protein